MNTPEQISEYQRKQDLQRFGKDTVFCIDAKKVQDSEGKWIIRAIIEANINGQLMWSAIESSAAEDDSHESIQSKVTDAINCIPDTFSDMLKRSMEQKPATVAGLDPAWEKDGKTMIATAEVTEDGIKVTDIREARETYQRLQSQGAVSATPIHPDIEGKPPIDPELLKPTE